MALKNCKRIPLPDEALPPVRGHNNATAGAPQGVRPPSWFAYDVMCLGFLVDAINPRLKGD